VTKEVLRAAGRKLTEEGGVTSLRPGGGAIISIDLGRGVQEDAIDRRRTLELQNLGFQEIGING
jgi:hypothetical protein